MRNLEAWNKACIVKYLWNIHRKADSVWIAWVHTYKLRGQSLWTIQLRISDSWLWKQVLKVSYIAEPMLQWSNREALWKFNDDRFNVAEVWNRIRPRRERVAWDKLV